MSIDVGAVVRRLIETWRSRRLWVCVAVGLGGAVTSALPLVASGITLAGMTFARYGIFRAAMGWLSPARRVVTALTLHLLLLFAALGTLVTQEVLTLLPGFNVPLKGAVAVAGVLLYTEASVRLVSRQLRRDREKTSLDFWEWALPVVLTVGTVVVSITMVAVAFWIYGRMAAGVGLLRASLRP